MKVVYAFFAARRYWTDRELLDNAYSALAERLCPDAERFLITEPAEAEALPEADCLVAVPMSGAVQKNIMAAAGRCGCAALYAAYIRGNAPDAVAEEMLRCNAAPTVMDCWAVLRRTHPRALLALNAAELERAVRVFSAYSHIRGAKLLLIGETEPWVISNAAELSCYERRFGVTIEKVAQAELAERYRSATDAEGELYYRHFSSAAGGCVEPTDADLRNAARMAYALVKTLEAHEAQGCALACFSLLAEGTTCCLGASYINDCTDMAVSCEGDMDSAVTMLFMKKLTGTRLWMANPGLQPDGAINFSHCTAPVAPMGESLPCILRSHHESGIGVSLQIAMPAGQPVTACRISDDASAITIHRGVSVEGPYEQTCRTQMHIRLDDMPHYLRTALGCHQVFAFEDIAEPLELLAGLFGLKLL